MPLDRTQTSFAEVTLAYPYGYGWENTLGKSADPETVTALPDCGF